jgi:two-component system, NtrC family, response regulator AtoC
VIDASSGTAFPPIRESFHRQHIFRRTLDAALRIEAYAAWRVVSKAATMERPTVPPTILIVDDEETIRAHLKDRFVKAGLRVLDAASGMEALERFAEGVDLTVLDQGLPDVEGLALLRRLREIDGGSLVIMMTGYASIENSVQAIKAGAYHYLSKPFELDDMMRAVNAALETTRLHREAQMIERADWPDHAFDTIIGRSPQIRAVKALLRKISESPASTLLLTGESGTGKDLAAKAVHFNSLRASKPFLNITCSALPEPLLESELFGHERGAFTDARQMKKGLLEQAEGGSVFLDEIGDTPLGIQAKLLRFLEEKSFRRVGGNVDIHLDIRIIAATNRRLEDAVREHTFREDLYYRLRVMPVTMPPLRDRISDIPMIVTALVDRFNRELGRHTKEVSAEAISMLQAHSWPGNVRELKNAVEGAMLLCTRDTLDEQDFQPFMEPEAIADFMLPPGGLVFEDLERDLVRQALERSGGNQVEAGVLLGMNRDQIRYRIAKFHLSTARSRTVRPD